MSTPLVVWLAAAWAAGWLVARRMRPLPPTTGAAPATVSVVVPVRDEEERLPRLLACLAADPARHHQLVVVDDGSTDRTVEVARAGGAEVVHADPPPGWTGKSWACWTGAGVATGDVLVFLDADVEPAPGAVDALASAAGEHGGLVSVQPWHRLERAYERLSAHVNLVAVLGAGTGTSAPTGRSWWRAPAAFGPAMAVRRRDYLAMGGHGAVRGDVAEDLALARIAAAHGLPVSTWTGGTAFRFRMYPGGVRQLVEGWSKNLATGAVATPPLRLVALVAWITASLQAAWLGGTALVPLSWAGLLAYAAFAVQAAVLLRRVGGFGLVTALAFPVPLLAFLALFVRSAVLTAVRRQVGWRGRTIPVGSRS